MKFMWQVFVWVNVIFYKINNAEQGYAVQECDARMLNGEQLPVTKIKKMEWIKALNSNRSHAHTNNLWAGYC